MQRLVHRYPRLVVRAIEMLFPLTTWSILTLPLWLSPFHPAIVAYFILTFDVYFLYKSLAVTIHSTISYLTLKRLSHVDWQQLARKLPDFHKIHHAVILTNYKESTDKVRITLEYLAAQDFPTSRIMIILAMEGREGNDAKIRAKNCYTEGR